MPPKLKRTLLSLGALLALILLALWLTGGLLVLERWVIEAQRAIQNELAAGVRAIKQGRPGALFALLAVCFSYGVLHAAGPGHGKVLIGGYGMGRRVPFWSLASISLAASLAQSLVAVALVYAGVALLGWTRDAAQNVAQDVMAPIGTLAIAAVGLWLATRGLRKIWRQAAVLAPQAHDHDHHHHHHDADCGCGHSHGPSLAELKRATSWKDRAALIIGVALRPCSGALFLLILTWQLGIALAGIAGAFAMGLGTSVITVAVAGMAVWAREGALANLPFHRVAQVLPWVEVLAGSLITLIALTLLTQTL
ncbi:nickel/cobalt transporter [Cypionkella sp. TWP1-2-1b2]|uniref:nickel/cobalt transporter n=1 Tax=Cypionkella sp. TWP1-2-1b2 TaxID=2804675 RepID=UPI003CF18618